MCWLINWARRTSTDDETGDLNTENGMGCPSLRRTAVTRDRDVRREQGLAVAGRGENMPAARVGRPIHSHLVGDSGH
jgi:hypothetical protein